MVLRGLGGVLVVAMLVLAGCIQAVDSPPEGASVEAADADGAVPDPAAAGVFNVTLAEYDFGWTMLSDPEPGQTYPAKLAGNVHYPSEGDGPFPVILFMHGRHGTCRIPVGEILGTHVCPDAEPVTTPVNSYTGYDYVGEVLASHGYVVASVDANHVNDRDLVPDYGAQARAQLLLRTLDAFERVHEGGESGAVPDALEGRLDLSRIGLMGHSRGGEGVTKAITYNHARAQGEPHDLRAVFTLAPTDFNALTAPDVAFAVLIPTCDGDVWNLQGAWIYDDSRYLREENPAPKIHITARGGNHNFYNTVWTWDDGNRGEAFCGEATEKGAEGGRFSAEDQRRHGLALMSGFFRAYVGGESALERMFTGAAPLPASACPGGVAPCEDRVLVSYHPAAPERLVLEDTRNARTLDVNDLGGDVTLDGFTSAAVCTPSDDCPAERTASRARQLALAWDGPATYALAVPPERGDVTAYEAVSLRVGVPNGDAANPPEGQDFRMVLTDATGATASVRASDHSEAAFTPPDETAGETTLNQVRVPLDVFEGVDLSQVREVAFHFDVTPRGSLQVTDVLLAR